MLHVQIYLLIYFWSYRGNAQFKMKTHKVEICDIEIRSQ